jgi:hypothetical protein
MSEICPKKILWEINTNHKSGIVDISSSYDEYIIKNIIFNTPYPVLFSLLLCREEKIRLKKDKAPIEENCPIKNQFNLNKNNEEIKYACLEESNMAHIYFRHANPQEGEGSCIVALISNRSEDPAKIADLLINTAEWLDVLDEKLYFHLKYSYPSIPLNNSDIKRKINEKLETSKIRKLRTCKLVESKKGDNLMIKFVKEKITEIGRFLVETA